MKPVHIHFPGDLFLAVPPESSDRDIDPTVVVMRPGEEPEIMTESECFDAVERFGVYNAIHTIDDPNTRAHGLTVAYDPRTTLERKGKRYVAGPVIVCGTDEDGDSFSLNVGQIMDAIVYLEHRTDVLCVAGSYLRAFRL